MNPVAEDILMHYGMKYRSGRYPWGSGDDPYQHSGDFLSRVETLEKQGLNEKQMADAMKMSTTDLRMQVRVAKHERRNLEADRARSLRDDGKSLNEIASIMGYSNDSSVRSLLNENTSINKNRANTTADILEKEVKSKKMVDIGAGAEGELGVSSGTLNEAMFILRTRGYEVYPIGIPNGPGKQTNAPILCTPDIEYKYVYNHMGDIQPVGDYHSIDGGTNYSKREYPSSINSDRVHIRYAEDGGIDKDGVIEIRRGVDDLNLGNSHYAQVRIMVDGTHYLKGMAMYSDNMPDGADIVFNTNKNSNVEKLSVLKKIQEDPDNPFGAYIKANGQSYYDDPNGKYTDPETGKKQSLSAINKLKEEGDWDSMSKNLSSQFLSKQPMKLIHKQLDLTYSDAEDQYKAICELNNPTLKKKLLLDFANECDGAAVHLKAAALPRQKTQVILPITEMPDNEVFAPNYNNGEQVALVRYPHAGTFEIPILTVNNKNASARSILGNVTDAVGINPKVAERLSGADFDGDQVIVIPTNDKIRIKSTPKLKELEGFDPKTAYAIPEGNPNKVKLMTKDGTQKQMGMISNLITDMTLKGANLNNEEMARAVRHSMVVIDAYKHKLDYKQSEKDNGIAELKKKYQGYTNDEGKEVGGASTLLSRRKQNIQVPETKGSGIIDPKTGEVEYKKSGRTYVDKKTGEVKTAMKDVKLINYVDDVKKLSSGTPQEDAYADYANKIKALANQARKEYKSTPNLKYDSDANKAYKNEVADLENQLRIALLNAPKERRALAITNSVVKAKIQDNPELAKDKKAQNKIRQQALNDARASVGADGKGSKITLTDKTWEAIQAGAITDSKLTQILRYADQADVKQRATPKTATTLSKTQIAKIKNMAAIGYTNAEIAKALGKSASTVSSYINS